MTPAQLEELRRVQRTSVPPLTVDDLEDKSERTLLYGYDCDRKTHHVFIQDGRIQVCKYLLNDFDDDCEFVDVTGDADYVPNKRVYPTRSDFEFCRLLCQRGVYIPFTNIDEEESKRTHILRYFGRTKATITGRSNENQELESA